MDFTYFAQAGKSWKINFLITEIQNGCYQVNYRGVGERIGYRESSMEKGWNDRKAVRIKRSRMLIIQLHILDCAIDERFGNIFLF